MLRDKTSAERCPGEEVAGKQQVVDPLQATEASKQAKQ